MNRLLSTFGVGLVVLLASSTFADGSADNVPTSVRRVPKAGVKVPPEAKKELEAGLAGVLDEYQALAKRERPPSQDQLADIQVLYKAVHDALTYDEVFDVKELEKAKGLLELAQTRLATAMNKKAGREPEFGLFAKGYVSKIDGSAQPYGLVVPPSYRADGSRKYRLDVWFHGRGETLSELNFLDERRSRAGEFAPTDTIVLHPYGRYCNANKFAGEIDVLEAIEAVKRNYRVDDDRISVRGFSMGGAACWQFAVHYPDRWFAANPGAGFAETPRFLKVFQNEKTSPTWYEKALWHLYDCTDVAENLLQCPTVAYSGELDAQKQAADVMAEALKAEGIELTHVIGPKTKHAYEKGAKREVERRMASLAEGGRARFPEEVRFSTYTLRYPSMNWVTIDALGEHWEKGQVHARASAGGTIEVATKNVEGFTLAYPSGYAPFPITKAVGLTVDGIAIEGPKPGTDRSWSLTLRRTGGKWAVASGPVEGIRKKHGLQGPIDDAFMDSFLFVKPTGKSRQPKVQAWVEAEMAHAIEHWRRQFRGEARVKDDTQVTDADVASSNLVLWGDPESNTLIGKLVGKLPIGWDANGIRAGANTFDSANHALILIHPNPLNANRYVVLNSGFTFREYDYLNNARQVPKLPDWAVIDLRTPPDSRGPGKVAAADFFDERWGLKPERKGP